MTCSQAVYQAFSEALCLLCVNRAADGTGTWGFLQVPALLYSLFQSSGTELPIYKQMWYCFGAEGGCWFCWFSLDVVLLYMKPEATVSTAAVAVAVSEFCLSQYQFSNTDGEQSFSCYHNSSLKDLVWLFKQISQNAAVMKHHFHSSFHLCVKKQAGLLPCVILWQVYSFLAVFSFLLKLQLLELLDDFSICRCMNNWKYLCKSKIRQLTFYFFLFFLCFIRADSFILNI